VWACFFQANAHGRLVWRQAVPRLPTKAETISGANLFRNPGVVNPGLTTGGRGPKSSTDGRTEHMIQGIILEIGI